MLHFTQKIAIPVIIIAFILVSQTGCRSSQVQPSQDQPQQPLLSPPHHVITITPRPAETPSVQTTPTKQELDISTKENRDGEQELDISAEENRDGELVFTIAVDDLITAYNETYTTDQEKSYLPDLTQWEYISYAEAPHSDYETDCYSYPIELSGPYIPSITLYVPSDSDFIQEIALDLDHHGYQEWAYELFEEKCLHILKTLLPDCGEGQLTKLFQQLYTLAERSDICYFGSGLGAQITPPILFWHESVGIYPCYAGGMLYINIIPVTQEYLNALTAKGSELHEIP